MKNKEKFIVGPLMLICFISKGLWFVILLKMCKLRARSDQTEDLGMESKKQPT